MPVFFFSRIAEINDKLIKDKATVRNNPLWLCNHPPNAMHPRPTLDRINARSLATTSDIENLVMAGKRDLARGNSKDVLRF